MEGPLIRKRTMLIYGYLSIKLRNIVISCAKLSRQTSRIFPFICPFPLPVPPMLLLSASRAWIAAPCANPITAAGLARPLPPLASPFTDPKGPAIPLPLEVDPKGLATVLGFPCAKPWCPLLNVGAGRAAEPGWCCWLWCDRCDCCICEKGPEII